jgi:hypothetical protein
MAGDERFAVMKVAIVDESGTPAPGSSNRYFVVAVLVADSPPAIITFLKRIRQSLDVKSRRLELKAARCRPPIIKRVLNWLGQGRFEIYLVIVHQEKMPADRGEELYQLAMARVVSRCLTNHPQLHVYLDRRYTNRHQAIQLEQTIRQAVSHIPQQVLILEQVHSAAHPGLQAVDFL